MRAEYKFLGAFALILVIFAVFSRQVGFHDSYEYITVAKSIAGINNITIFNTHPIVYPFIIAIFLKILGSLTIIKLLNVIWVFLIGLVLLVWLKNKKAFIIFALSPLTWFISIQTTPILPAGFFFLLSYIFLKKENIKFNKIYSGFFLGLSFAFYTPMLLLGGIFILIYFWNENLSAFAKYSASFIFGALPTFILDWYYFKNPIYSTIRYFGGNLVVLLGLHATSTTFNFLKNFTPILILIAISPFLFRIYKLNFKENKKEIIFLGIISLIFILRVPQIKYFFLISPIFILLLAKVISWKEVKWHAIISVILIIFLTFGFFVSINDAVIDKDIHKVILDFNQSYFIAGSYEAPKFATFLWEDSPKIIWFEDYEASLNKSENLKEYSFLTEPRIDTRELIEFSVNFKRPKNISYENPIFISEKKDLMKDKFELIKCYELLCAYENE